jgi:hypothetical protein
MKLPEPKSPVVRVDSTPCVIPSMTCALPPPASVFLTVRQTAQRFPAFTEAALRSLIFNAKQEPVLNGVRSKGFDDVIVRVPGQRKVLISEQRLIEWLSSNQTK